MAFNMKTIKNWAMFGFAAGVIGGFILSFIGTMFSPYIASGLNLQASVVAMLPFIAGLTGLLAPIAFGVFVAIVAVLGKLVYDFIPSKFIPRFIKGNKMVELAMVLLVGMIIISLPISGLGVLKTAIIGYLVTAFLFAIIGTTAAKYLGKYVKVPA